MILREHHGGILTLHDGDRLVERFDCRHDTHRALELLRQINALRLADGTPIFAQARHRGFYLWPFFQEVLFHGVCVPWARYREVIAWLGARAVVCDHGGLDAFAPFLEILRGGPRPAPLRSFAFDTLLALARRRSDPHPLALYDLIDHDFRSRAIRETLEAMEIPYSRFRRFETRRDGGAAFSGTRHIPWAIALGRKPGRAPALHAETKTDWPPAVLDRVLAWMDGMVRQAADEIEALVAVWARRRPRLIYGIDDCGAPNPIWAAAKVCGIPTVGHMHGSYTACHAGWMRHGIPHAFNNVRFDRLFVWGRYWKRKLLQYTNLFEEAEVEVACPMRPPPKYQVRRASAGARRAGDRRIVLVPYEFLADQPAIGVYMDQMIARGWRVLLKTRPDEPKEDQLASYQLRHRAQVEIVETLSDELLSTVDAAAGTMTTFLYELLPYGIPVWYLETGFTMMEDMVTDGLAHRVTLAELASPPDEWFVPRYSGDGLEFLDTRRSLREVLEALLREHGLR